VIDHPPTAAACDNVGRDRNRAPPISLIFATTASASSGAFADN